MAIEQSYSCSHADDDDYIDMELMSSSQNFFCYSISSPPQSREFEFQMSLTSNDREITTFPADELFYKGKLLPLHLPPRLQMVQKLLQNPTTNTFEPFEENCSIPFVNLSCSPTTTPLESCNISPSESCRVSSELNPDEYFFEFSSELNSFIGNHPIKKSWTEKLKQSLLGQKLKASSAYVKSLFNKSGCTAESCAKPAHNAEPEAASKGNDCLSKCMNVAMKKNSFSEFDSGRRKISSSLVRSIEREMARDGFHSQRRSFSGAIQRHSTNKQLSSSSGSSSSSSSSSFSFSSSNGFCDLQLLKRSSSANSEIESSIEGAIAYCKKSHEQLFLSRNTATDHQAGVCSLSAASGTVTSGDQERVKICAI
ncbi:probable membrane-associated kinase regulator 4 [Manihot esculenta]|uniref:Membrane-associated kinase regulator 4 n=1 Tax=Manihot esculenta TaxID=3983 RepID=A0A2C9VE85_MANES|nr:probable membrane-associated kinase regulator 4 [Manihot esculenta]XP_043815278.1 probable membrane-associated kinase regulator 4 [Manihot esculenta]OAY43467.1 hypothetical protein MANES_08G072800v8 [Manihot esculenta]